MIQRLQVHIHLVLLERFAIVEVVRVLSLAIGYHLLRHGSVMFIATCVCQVLPPPLRNALISVLLLLVRQTVD